MSLRSSENGTSHGALLGELWEAAVRLRGSIEPADYKRYVLPIIFLRFLSLRYEARRAEIERLLDDRASDYYSEDLNQREQILEDPDEYRAAGAFIVPKAARWTSIVEEARRDDLKSHLDDILQSLEDHYPDKLRGLLPRIYAGSNLDVEDLRGLINTFSHDVFSHDHDGEDLIGRVYEYFIGEFANSEGKRGGEYFTPVSIVRTLVAMLEPREGIVLDPCCGAGGMFVQSDLFTQHSHQLSFIGQESKDFTYRLGRMNLFIHGLDGHIELANSYFDDRHADVKADFILANPPFNDGSKSKEGWGADKIPPTDERLTVNGQRLPLATRNANTMWILHFLHHLKDTGTAGFVMATGELANAEIARATVRQVLVESDLVDCIVSLSGQLFANTQIPCSLWFLSRNRGGLGGYRDRRGEVLFIDGRSMGALIPGSRKQKQLSSDEIEQISKLYRQFRYESPPSEQSGFVKVASLDEIRNEQCALAPGRYVGSAEVEEDEESLADVLPELRASILADIDRGRELDDQIRAALEGLVDG